MTIRVVLAEDNLLVREGLKKVLASRDELELAGVCTTLDELIDVIDTAKPEIVLTDIRMPPDHSDEGIRAAEYCRREHPEMGVILLSQYVEPAYVRVLLSHGAYGRGYLLKERVANADDLIEGIREVARGGSVIDPKVVEALVSVRTIDGSNDLAQLTPRELDVLASMAQGKNNAGIATELSLSRHAVEKHINSIFNKLGLGVDPEKHPRVRAVLMYLAEGKGQGK